LFARQCAAIGETGVAGPLEIRSSPQASAAPALFIATLRSAIRICNDPP
jgi:hypothetical protein